MRTSISFSTALENECYVRFGEKHVRLGLREQVAAEDLSTVTTHFTCLGYFEVFDLA